LPVAVMFLPLLDLGLAVVRRLRAGQSPFSADAKHLHHRMLRLGHSHARAVLILYTWTALIAFGSVLLLFKGCIFAACLIGGLVAITLIFTFYPLRMRQKAREEISCPIRAREPNPQSRRPGPESGS